MFIVSRAANPEFVKVLGFGVAKLRGGPHATQDTLTATGMNVGTAPYMAPEQWQARTDIDGRADIYSLGVIVFELLTGVRPYSAASAQEWTLLHAQEAPPPDLQTYGVPAQLARAVRRMMARRPEQRQQSMREVVQDLSLAGHGLHPSPPPPPGYLQPAPPPDPPPAPYRIPYSQADPLARARLRRIGELLLGAAVVFIYLVVYWQDTWTFLRTFAKSLRFGF